jgi:glycosyltransferase involved in cell wall biosynthesis
MGRAMHLAINGTEIGRQRGGNESYLLGLWQGLQTVPVDVTWLLTPTGRETLPDVHSARYESCDVGIYRRLPFFVWQQTRWLRRLRPDWYVSTFFLPPLAPCRTAVLVHDLSFRAHPDFFPATIAWYMRVLTGLAIRQATRVIALSEFTRSEIARFYPRALDKTAVVHPGVVPRFEAGPAPDDAARLARYDLPRGYILAIGNVHPRKNLARLLDAYAALRRRQSDVPPMVWVGVARWGSDALLARARRAGVLLPGFVAEADLPAVLREAAVLVYPSLYEGFGLPPLEGMACGTPVIVHHGTSLPEAVGEAALMVDARDGLALAGALARVLEDAALRVRLREAGLARARAFTWERTARNLIEVLGSEA